jgi:hypothetical protein
VTPEKNPHTLGEKVIGAKTNPKVIDAKLTVLDSAKLILLYKVIFKLISKILSLEIVCHESNAALKAESTVIQASPT